MQINSIAKNKQSSTINYLRAIAIIFVVIHHSMTYGTSRFNVGAGSKTYSLFVFALDSVHVPLFFMISGYLCHKQNVPKYYKKKLLQILVPFLFFTSLMFVPNLFIDKFRHVGSEFLNDYVFGYYYWFSYCLLVMFLLAPLLWKIKRKFILICLFFLLLAFNIVNGFLGLVGNNGPFQIFNVLIYGPWFLFGYILKQLNAEKLLDKKPIKHAALPLSVAVAALAIFLRATELLNPFTCKVMLSFSASYVLLYVFSLIPFKIIPLHYVSKYSYQLFLLDRFIKVTLFAITSKLFTLNPPTVVLLALINVAINTLISWTAHKIKYVRILFGLS